MASRSRNEAAGASSEAGDSVVIPNTWGTSASLYSSCLWHSALSTEQSHDPLQQFGIGFPEHGRHAIWARPAEDGPGMLKKRLTDEFSSRNMLALPFTVGLGITGARWRRGGVS